MRFGYCISAYTSGPRTNTKHVLITADVLSFPKERTHVALTPLKVAHSREKRAPYRCIALQRGAIALIALELKEAKHAGLVAQRALDSLGEEAADTSKSTACSSDDDPATMYLDGSD